MTIESRFTRAVVVESDDIAHTVDLRIASYGTVDTFGTVWLRGCFDETLARGYLPLAFQHSWADPVGRMVEDLGDDAEGRVVRFEFDDFDAVPRARQIYSQLKSGTLKDCSIGFSGWVRSEPTNEELAQYPGAVDLVHRVDLDELSVVLHGAVPSAELVGIRQVAEDVRSLAQEIADAEIVELDSDPEVVVDYSESERIADETLRRLGL